MHRPRHGTRYDDLASATGRQPVSPSSDVESIEIHNAQRYGQLPELASGLRGGVRQCSSRRLALEHARVEVLADLAFRAAERKILQRQVDACDTIAIAADADRAETTRLDHAALLPDPAALGRTQADATLLPGFTANAANPVERRERVTVIALGAARRA